MRCRAQRRCRPRPSASPSFEGCCRRRDSCWWCRSVVGAAWLADWWDLGAVLVPGQFAGTAAACLVGVMLVRRWERAHGRQVVVGRDGSGDTELYAAALPGYTGSVQTSAIDGS